MITPLYNTFIPLKLNPYSLAGIPGHTHGLTFPTSLPITVHAPGTNCSFLIHCSLCTLSPFALGTLSHFLPWLTSGHPLKFCIQPKTLYYRDRLNDCIPIASCEVYQYLCLPLTFRQRLA